MVHQDAFKLFIKKCNERCWDHPDLQTLVSDNLDLVKIQIITAQRLHYPRDLHLFGVYGRLLTLTTPILLKAFKLFYLFAGLRHFVKRTRIDCKASLTSALQSFAKRITQLLCLSTLFPPFCCFTFTLSFFAFLDCLHACECVLRDK